MKTKTISVNENFINDSSFVIIRRQNDYYQLNDKFEVLDSNKKFISIYYLRNIKTVELLNIDSQSTFLAENIQAQLFIDIQKECYNIYKSLTIKEVPNFFELLSEMIGEENSKQVEIKYYSSFSKLPLYEIVETYLQEFPLALQIKVMNLIRSYELSSKMQILTFSTRELEENTIKRQIALNGLS